MCIEAYENPFVRLPCGKANNGCFGTAMQDTMHSIHLGARPLNRQQR
jgi:hypothetical protein